MSQIPRSQFVLKKRQTPSSMVPVLDIENGAKAKKSHTNGPSNVSGNGHKNGSYDNDVVIIEDEGFAVVSHEEVVASVEVSIPMEQFSPSKKKRSRRSKDSTESKDSDLFKKSDEATKTPSPEKTPKSAPKLDTVEVMHVEDQTTVETIVTTSDKELKIVKMTSEIMSASKRRSDRLQNASTIVNLSTVSSSDSTKHIGEETFDVSAMERRVSGRRSTRPIDDIKYSYRSQINDSMNTSTNATVGSDNNSLLTTPGTDRKRRALHESMENIESPKKSRLNLSGLFNSFSSPVAILRNRFKRTNIASTPIVGGGEALMNESVESLDTSGSGDQFKDVDLNEKEEFVSVDKDELKVITTPIKKTSCIVM